MLFFRCFQLKIGFFWSKKQKTSFCPVSNQARLAEFVPTSLKLVTVLKLTQANRAGNVITFISIDRSINTDRPCIVMNHLLHSKSQILFSSKRDNMSPCIKHKFSLRELLFEPKQFRTKLLHHLLHKIIRHSSTSKTDICLLLITECKFPFVAALTS